MRAPFQKASVPRIRALGPALMRTRAAPPAPPPGGVFRDFVATLERLERATDRSLRRKLRAQETRAAKGR